MNKSHSRGAKTIDISTDQIGLPTPNNRNAQSSLYHENRYIKKQNDILKKQLETISTRLDGEIKKRMESNKKRPWNKDTDEISYMELQNAYKKCEIYKKQVNFYRKRLSTIQDESRYDQFDHKINEYIKENIQLRNEIKSLKKLIKLQQKGLVEMGAQEYAKIIRQSEQLKQQNRRLKKYLSQYRLASLKTRQSIRADEKSPESKRQSIQNDLKNDDPDSLKEKLEKSYQKTKQLNNEINNLKSFNENYKFQIQQKDKELQALRSRIANLRKNNDELLSQRNLKKANKYAEENTKRNQRSDSKGRFFKTEPDDGNQQRPLTYPIKLQKGKGTANSIKWSDEVFNSKIKQLQVFINENGEIKDLHARYEKGESKKYVQANSKYKSNILACTDQEQIISISGVFIKKCLKFLTIKTNNKRGQSFGIEPSEEDSNLETFNFTAKQSQVIGALFGQKSEEGITKLGCFILKA